MKQKDGTPDKDAHRDGEMIRFRCVSAFPAVGNPYHTEAKLSGPALGKSKISAGQSPAKMETF
ncbi:MAG: hypothetical protein C6W56_15225 [Caldibacillus debilis]|nr:MAG: hypothetical protein C6W56_15225 [Caldibacillus debilis]